VRTFCHKKFWRFACALTTVELQLDKTLFAKYFRGAVTGPRIRGKAKQAGHLEKRDGEMNRTKIFALIIFAVLSGCANLHRTSTNASWEKFHSETIAQRDAGKLSPLQAQLDLWSKYRELFGEDSTMNGFYAYSVKLMSAVEAGKISLDEAQTLIDVREHEISSRKIADAERRLAYDPNGNPSD
jgi:hypothetical protein